MHYRPWFCAAALYNLSWGTLNIIFPSALFRLIDAPVPNYLPLWQVVGMFVLVFSPGYWWTARHPSRFPHLILIGMAGKVLGPLGFAVSALSGQLPVAFGLTILTNDLMWWPIFALYLRDAAGSRGGWRALLRGD
jgi:small multidrug resistance pump